VTPARRIALDLEYARFNAGKALGDARESRFRREAVGPLTITTDPVRDDAYYHRILGLTPGTLPSLDEAIARLDAAPTVRVDVDAVDSEALTPALTSRGFATGGRLLWLAAEPRIATPGVPVLRLGPGQRDLVRDLLHAEWPVEDRIWKLREANHCTDRFRAFGIRGADGGLDAMATSFIGEHGVVLGNAYTREEVRGRGYQRALLVARVSDAAESGVDLVLTDVEPGTTSHRNCERSGFRTLVEQVIWERRRDEQSDAREGGGRSEA
jgi:hypothetical protein